MQYTQTLQLINSNKIKLNLEIIYKSNKETKRRKLGFEIDRMS